MLYEEPWSRVFCEETWRFACQSGPRVVAKMARPAMLPTVVGLTVALEALVSCGTYRRAASQMAPRRRGRSDEPLLSPMRCTTLSCASSVRRCQRGGEQAWEWPGRWLRGMRRGMGMIRACVGHARVMMYRGGACAGSCRVCMWSMGLCCSKLVYKSIKLASSTVSVGVSVFRSRFNVHALQELMARAPCKRRHNPVGPP